MAMITHIELSFNSLFLIVASQFIGVFTFFQIILTLHIALFKMNIRGVPSWLINRQDIYVQLH